LQVSAHCRPDIVYNPGQVSFGVIAQGTTPVQTIEIEYAGMLDWRIEELLSAGPYLEASYEEMYRRPGQTGYRVKVRLKPEAPPGPFQHELQLRTNDAGSPVVPVLVEASIRAPVSATPDPVYFGAVRLNKKAARRVVLRGERPFRILRVEGLGDELTTAVPSVAAAVHTLVLEWKPRRAGDLNRQLVIHTDLDPQATLHVTAQGQAVP
jgi:hypothetical protein